MRSHATLPITLVLTMALFLAIAGVAESRGKLLTMERATTVALGVAQDDCRKKRSCDGAGVRACKRITLRKVRCASRIEGTDSDGAYACERPVLVSRHRKTGEITHTTRDQACAHSQPG
jgi:hypothetical protein